MGFWRRLFGASGTDEVHPQRLDYLNEALALERQGDYEAALTSYRLALRDHPHDARILQNMAIALTKTRRIDEAIRHYRRALELDPELAGAHYGLAFLLLKRGDPDGATQHLRAFLAHPPKGPDAQKWIEHANQALPDLGASGPTPAATQAGVGPLPSNPIAIRVLAAADTLFAPGATRDSVSLAAKPDSLSDSLTVRLQDTTAAGPVDLSGRPVAFALTVYPGGGPGANVALVTSDTARAPVAADTVTTTVGIAAVELRLLAGPPPDRAVVTVNAHRRSEEH